MASSPDSQPQTSSDRGFSDEKRRSVADNDVVAQNVTANDIGRRQSHILGEKSPGVERVEAIAKVITRTDRIFLFLGVFIIAYAYGLDGTLRYVYQPYALGSFESHSLLATVNVLRAVIAAAAQPTAAKIADVFGRAELIMVSVFFYILGSIIEAVANDVDTFSAGACIYQIGYTMVLVLVEVIIADLTSTRSRLFFSYIPATPFIINTWVSGDISAAVLGATNWRWGIGMWCIIYTACAMPLIVSLLIVGRRAKKQGLLNNYKSAFQREGGRLGLSLFWSLDIVGIILLIAILALILSPLTLAGGLGATQWSEAHIIAPIVVGIVCIPAFVFWELWCPHPMVPFRLFRDRGVWGPMGIALFLNFAWGMQADYLYTVLVVAFDFSITSATRIVSLYSFTSVITGTILGLIVYKVRRLKPFIVAGVCIYMVALGLLVHYRGGTGGSHKNGVIGAQVLLGFAGGMFPYPAQASLQVQLKHEQLAVMTGLYLATYNIGSALGYTVSGALYTQVLPSILEDRLAFSDNSTLASTMYGNPLVTVYEYPVGTPERDAIVYSFQHVQRLLCITGVALCVPLLVFAAVIRDPRLDDRQNLVEGEKVEGENREGVVAR